MELLLVLALMGLALGIALLAWNNTRGRAEAKSAARAATVFIHRARMNSIYEGINHFVVINPQARRLEIYADNGTIPASFDSTDRRVAATSFTVDMALPAEPASLPAPIGGGILSSAWSLPVPDEEARWGADLKGLMITPTGVMQSAEATPDTISAGIIVFSDAQNHAAAVAIRGLEGSVRAYEYFHDAWEQL